MSAIITTGFRVSNARSLINTSDTYYMFIGRPQSWADDLSPDAPVDGINHSFKIWEDMISLKKVTPASMMSHGITKRSWASGKYYDLYRHDYGEAGITGKHIDTGVTTNPANLAAANYYVVTANGNVYVCISNNGGVVSTTNPQGLGPDANYICSGADGYKWKLVAKTSTADTVKFSTPNFHPIKTLAANPGSGDEYYDQWLAQQSSNAHNGSIFNVVLNNGGTGYGANLSNQAGIATVVGDGSGATVTVNTNAGGTITALQVTNYGTGYTWAAITFSTGSSASATAIITPLLGLGGDPVSDLCASNIITNMRFEYADGGDFPVTNDYRRVGIIVNPTDYDTSNVMTASTATACLTIKVTAGWTGTWAPDMVIKDSLTGAHARIVDANVGSGGDAGKMILRVVRNRDDNQLAGANASASFVTSNPVVSVSGGSASGTINAVVSPEVQPRSGQVIYVENRRPITRSIDQIESITTVFEY